jgi:hypothetical protein
MVEKALLEIIDWRAFPPFPPRQASPTEEFFIEKITTSKKTC